jgi:hypothetical protein
VMIYFSYYWDDTDVHISVLLAIGGKGVVIDTL